MNGLDLFSGIGGISLALSEWVKTIAYCETDKYAQGVLLSRMQDGSLDRAPIWDDVRTLTGEMLPRIDIISGGFPCQDISVAGLGKGLEGERSGLFFEIIRLTKETSPTFVFLENVPAIRTRGLREVVRSFTNLRYDCRWTRVSAAEVGAPHLRERWFLLAADSECNRGWPDAINKRTNKEKSEKLLCKDREAHSNDTSEICGYISNTMREGLERQWEKSCGIKSELNNTCDNRWWEVEPNVGRVVNELPNRVDRIKCLGNSVVPLQAKEAFKKLLSLK